jgi:hypothetical protein
MMVLEVDRRRPVRCAQRSGDLVFDCCGFVGALGAPALDGCPRQKSVRIEQYGSQDSMTNIDQRDRHELER